VVALGMRGRSTTLLWVRNTSDRWCDELYGSTAVRARNVTVRVPDMPRGRYRIRAYGTEAGEWGRQSTARSNGTLTLSIPTLTTDLALRIERSQ
jgi:hypothetical protein